MKSPEGETSHKLPRYDFKVFDPSRHQQVREDLIASLRHKSEAYFIGLPSSHNLGQEVNRDLGLSMHGGLDKQVTFSDLLINSNYRLFLRNVVPILKRIDEITVVGNHRMRPANINPNWRLVAIPDDAMSAYSAVIEATIEQLLALPPKNCVLASASSLSNVLGMHVDVERPDLTFIDVGTALHPFTGMGTNDRDYHSLLSSFWGVGGLRRLRYRFAPHYRIRW